MTQTPRLSAREIVAVAKYLEAHRDSLTTDRPAYEEVARHATAWCKIPIAAQQIKRLAAEIGIIWQPRRPATQKELAKALPQLFAHIVSLSDQLQYPVDDRLRDMAFGTDQQNQDQDPTTEKPDE